jgi:hypothetical protein
MAEADEDEALLLREDGLVHRPPRVQMRQQVRHLPPPVAAPPLLGLMLVPSCGTRGKRTMATWAASAEGGLKIKCVASLADQTKCDAFATNQFRP